MKKAGKGTALKQKRTWKQEVQHNWPLYVLILPSFVLAIIFCYVPMGGLVMAFQDYKPWLGITGSQFVGMDNFRQIFEFKESYQAIINTLIIAVSKIILGLIVPIIMALLLNEVHNIGLKKGIQTLVYLPHFLSWVTVAGMLRDILGTDGIVNMVLQKFGIDPIFFLGEAGMFRQIVVASDLWKGFGFGMIVYLAALQGVSRDLYEAASLDGANKWQQFVNITWPCVTPTTFYILMMLMVSTFKSYDTMYITTQGGPGEATKVLAYHIYKMAFENSRFGYASAVAMVLLAIILVLTTIQFKCEKKFTGDM